jgi:hypothetical protein
MPDNLTDRPTRHNLAVAYAAAGRTDDAIAIYEPLLTDRQRILGPEHPNTLNTRNHLGIAYQAVARVSDADRLRRRGPAGTSDGPPSTFVKQNAANNGPLHD